MLLLEVVFLVDVASGFVRANCSTTRLYNHGNNIHSFYLLRVPGV